MYKLVAFDLDGTIFTDDKQLPPGLFDEIRRLSDKGIVCAPASGRFESELRDLFEPVADLIGMVGCNAHQVALRGETLSQLTFPEPLLFTLARECLAVPGGYVNFSSPRANIVMGSGPGDDWTLHTYLKDWETAEVPTDGVRTWGDEDIVKVTYFHNDGVEDAPARFANVSDRLTPVMTSHYTCDFSLDGSSKATGLKILADALGIGMDQVMAFGDHMNDVEMIREAGCGVAMDNAIPEVKAVANRVCPSNQDYGVMQVLAEL